MIICKTLPVIVWLISVLRGNQVLANVNTADGDIIDDSSVELLPTNAQDEYSIERAKRGVFNYNQKAKPTANNTNYGAAPSGYYGARPNSYGWPASGHAYGQNNFYQPQPLEKTPYLHPFQQYAIKSGDAARQHQIPAYGMCSGMQLPAHVIASCHHEQCELTCPRNYGFPDGSTELKIICMGGQWLMPDSQHATVPPCQPVCLPACENNGICWEPGMCKCSDNFSGPLCQYRKSICAAKPPLPMNSHVSCKNNFCNAVCMRGFQFPDGSNITNIECLDGQWLHKATGLPHPPDCLPTCTPACQHDGQCISLNVCKCTKMYRGSYCQHNINACNVTNTGFNGNSQCSYDNDEAKCTFVCLDVPGLMVEGNLDIDYYCRYDTGKFVPSPTPKCIYPPQYELLPGSFAEFYSEHTGPHIAGVQISHGTTTTKKSQQLMELLAKYRNMDEKTDWWTSEESLVLPGSYALYEASDVSLLRNKAAKAAVCVTWGGNNVKTFDGLIYKTPLNCLSTLVTDSADATFDVRLKPCAPGSHDTCAHVLKIYWQSVVYTLENLNGSVNLQTETKNLPLPVHVLGMKVITVGQQIQLSLESIGLQIDWDREKCIAIRASSNLWKKLGGLCGSLDGDFANDFVSPHGVVLQTVKTFVDSWKVGDKTDLCLPNSHDNLNDLQEPVCDSDKRKKALDICGRLLSNSKLSECIEPFNKVALLQNCVDDYCNCPNVEQPETCNCEAVSVLALECSSRGVELKHGYRNLEICPIRCDSGRIYMGCGPSVEASCEVLLAAKIDKCVEGCFCPAGTVQHKDTCIAPEQCPCSMRGKEFKPDETVKKSCNTCVCKNGQWVCSDENCGARCGAVGDPHYQTFDGKRYNFMGKCSYYLLKTDNLTVETENVACSGALSENLSFEVTSENPSCTKSVTIKLTLKNGVAQTIKLEQGLVTRINDKEITKFPKVLGAGEVLLRQASSTFITVDFPNGLRIFWDGVSRVYVDAPASFRDKTAGLCGTFNSNTQDDFLTPEGDIETAVEPFADKWRTKDTCEFDVKTASGPHPCSVDPELRIEAEKHCAWILDDVFQDCHWTVEPEQYYEDCLYDVCACKESPDKCFCPILAAYGDECSRQGIKTGWRLAVKDCAIKCPLGQVYDECGNSCSRTCEDLATKASCDVECVEGCHCPHGQYLNGEGECVPQAKCPCTFDGISFQPAYKEVRPGDKFMDLCTCENGEWECEEASEDDQKNYPPASELRAKCEKQPYVVFSKCVAGEPKTCKNMDTYVEDLSDCKPGCSCMTDYVYDMSAERCVLPGNCSCHHAGKSFADGEQMKDNCNMCVCKAGSWSCSTNDCQSTCSVWGDSHFTTFDNHEFDFQGACDYVLSKGVSENGDGFTITIQNVFCGSMGVTCSKSLEIALSGSVTDSIVLNSKSSYTSDPNNSLISRLRELVNAKGQGAFHIYKAGVFIVVEVIPLGLQVKWDEGTRVYVKLSKAWKHKVSGLCGNYNDNAMDDMKTPAQSLETSPLIFGHAWKVQNFCAQPVQPIDACKEHPERETWAQLKCGILKSDIFNDCHNEIPLEPYLKRCIFDTCACDQGGDCECLCTAIAAYAHACSQRDINIRWRTTHFCPMQCDAHCADYDACTPSCGVETCDNFLDQGTAERMCNEEHCMEGCKIRACEPGMIYLNDSYTQCVPKAECKPFCMLQNGTTYYEGDVIYQDACATCHCSRKHEVCSGVKCADLVPTQPPNVLPEGTTQQPMGTAVEPKCVHGWTRWFDKDQHGEGDNLPRLNEEEKLPRYDRFESIYGTCQRQYMTKIECRVMGTQESAEFMDENVSCNLQNGLVCLGNCHDYEIRVFCQCQALPETTEAPVGACDSVMAEYKEFPGDCHKFLHCQPKSVSGDWHYVTKTCGDSMMFNPTINVCDHIAVVQQMKPSCGETPIKNEAYVSEPTCPDGMIMSSCANQCEHTCHFYAQVLAKRGLCKAGEHCKAGCVDATRSDCPSQDKYWRDEVTCVDMDECPCLDNHDGYVQPHMPVIGETEVCQCLSNVFSCLPNKVPKKVEPQQATPQRKQEQRQLSVIPVSLTPPPHCEDKNLRRMFEDGNSVPEVVFNASSQLSPQYAAKYGVLSTENNDNSWSPSINDQMQYLEVTFNEPYQLFGISMAGSPNFDSYVTLFKILYSYDGIAYHYLVDDSDGPQLFKGPLDSRQVVQTLFEIPIEAKSVRVYPLKWHRSIAMRIDLLKCYEHENQATTEAPNLWTDESGCIDPMGIENGKMKSRQIRASSVYPGSTMPVIDMLKLSSPLGWRPLLNTPNEYVEFNFLEPRNISGFITKGGAAGWVTGYKIYFSKNRILWNKILSHDGKPKVFMGNHDEDSEQVTQLHKPILTQYFKIVPATWEHNINMRVEPLGCYMPNVTAEEVPEVEASPKPACLVCKGVGVEAGNNETSACQCRDELFWDGSKCVQSALCPCIDNYMTYAVGAKFENSECEECVCLLGGRSSCKQKKCAMCEGELRAVISVGCFCKCEPCPKDQRLCPSSGDCIPEMLWCNGVHDCADDEDASCQVKFEVIPDKLINKTEKPIVECPEPICPPNMQLKIIEKKARKMSSMFTSTTTKEVLVVNEGNGIMKRKIITSSSSSEEIIPMSSGEIEVNAADGIAPGIESNLCHEFTCIPQVPKITMSNDSVICVEPKCPDNFDVEVDRSNVRSGDCFKYTCVLKPQKDDVCEISGSTFTTFDGTEFKYELCSHILARDVDNTKWMITAKMQCDIEGGRVCRKVITFKDHLAPATLIIMPNMKLNFNGFEYTAQQLINSPICKASFVISQPGNTLLIVSQRHGVWVLYDDSGYVKIGMSSKFISTVDGLCGYYNGMASDDKRTPNGTIVASTMKFGDSWYDGQIPKEQCLPHTCPLDIQKKALNLCNTIRHPTFVECGKSVNYKQFASKCIETVCECLLANNSDVNACKCHILQDFVNKCLTVNSNLQLNSWRAIHQCEISCPAPLVHLDCYKRRCEPSCTTTLSNDDCPLIPDACFAGCYCPEGTVRKDNKCLSVNDCKDCVCNSFGPAKYLTYDQNSFTFDVNCTYLLSRDILTPPKYAFQVYVTMADCMAQGICANSYHVLMGNHSVHMTRTALVSNDVQLSVDGSTVTQLPYEDTWFKLGMHRGEVLMLSLPAAHIQLTINFQTHAFALEVPSVKYGNKMEGLCGNCNGQASDDLQPNPVKLVAGLDLPLADIIESWQADEPQLGGNFSTCRVDKPKDNCTRVEAGEQDPCMLLYNQTLFGQCNMLIDPSTYVQACQQDTCRLGHAPNATCDALAAYSKACLRLGVCLNWRGPSLCPYSCTSGMNYQPCACRKTCDTIANMSQYDAEVMKTNSFVKTVKVEDMCEVEDKVEGCFCAPGKVFDQGKCISERECLRCNDEERHLPGDKWQQDKCIQCECTLAGKVSCMSQKCLVEENICADGYLPKTIVSAGECCPKYVCVPEVTSAKQCLEPMLPVCGPGQFKMQKLTADGCPQYVCACKPKEECESVLPPRDLKPGQQIIIEDMGCCPTQRIVCDKNKCPEKLMQCVAAHFEVVVRQEADACCPEYACELPKDVCVVEYAGMSEPLIKQLHEKWPHPHDACKHESCSYGANGTPQVVTSTDLCNTQCPNGFTYESAALSGQCCGECRQTACVFEARTYEPNASWHSADNCTIYKCETTPLNKTLVVSSIREVCPDVSACLPHMLRNDDKGGCCQYCQAAPPIIQDKSLCLPVSLAANETAHLVQIFKTGIGKCINSQPIEGFTECEGSCSSGSKYNTVLRIFDKICNCCNIQSYRQIDVELLCENGVSITEKIDIPSACHCAACLDSATYHLHPDFDVRLEPLPLAQLREQQTPELL